MNRVLAKLLENHFVHKLAHHVIFFMHKNGSKKIAYILPSFLAGSGVGYCAARYKADPTILKNILKYIERADTPPVESTLGNDAASTNEDQIKVTTENTEETSVTNGAGK